MTNPKVSVLIPAYNYAHYLSEAIDSVITQSFKNFELIVIDNCSTDNTEEIVNAYMKDDNRVKFVRNDENIGMYRNYNQALLLARGEYIKFLNADDKFESTILEKFVNTLDTDPTISIVTSYRQYFGSKNDILISPFQGKVESTEAILSSLEKGNWIGEPTTVMFRKSNLNLGLFDTNLKMFADFDMWIRHLQAGHICIHPEVLSYFRIHDEQGTCHLNQTSIMHLHNEAQSKFYVISKLLFNDIKIEQHIKNKIIHKNFKRLIRISCKEPSFYKNYQFLYKASHFFIFFLSYIKMRIQQFTGVKNGQH